MNPDLKITLDAAQLIAIGGVIWGLARMSKSVDTLVKVTDSLITKFEKLAFDLLETIRRVSILEDRSPHRKEE